MLTAARTRQLDALLAAKREQHPELRRPVTSAGLRAVLRREGVVVKVLPHPRDAELLAIEGRWVVVVNEAQPHAERLVAVAHEYGHFIAHIDPGEPRTYDASPPWYDDVREAEADYLAELLVRGPASSPPPFVRRGRANSRRVDPDQLGLDVREHAVQQAEFPISEIPKPASAKTLRNMYDDARAYEGHLVKTGAKKMTPRIVADGRTPDDERIAWGNGTRPTRYVEPDGHRWSIYNARIAIVDGRATLALVRDFMDRRATHRIFVDSAGQRRVYRFVPRELRAYKVKHLERQLAAAKPWPRRRGISRSREAARG